MASHLNFFIYWSQKSLEVWLELFKIMKIATIDDLLFDNW